MVVSRVLNEIADELVERAQWLRSERMGGGNASHLQPREEECLYLSKRLRDGWRLFGVGRRDETGGGGP